MKKFSLLLFFVFITSFGFAQNLFSWDAQSKSMKAVKTITVSPANKSDLYKKVYGWFGQTFKNPYQVIKFEDPENGTIRGTHSNSYTYMMNQVPFYHDISVQVSDNIVVVLINNIKNTSGVTLDSYIYKKNGELRGSTSKMQTELNAKLSTMFAGIEKAVKVASTARIE